MVNLITKTNRPMTIVPGEKSTGSSTARHPYMRNNWKGSAEIQETFRKIYEVADQIKERNAKVIGA